METYLNYIVIAKNEIARGCYPSDTAMTEILIRCSVQNTERTGHYLITLDSLKRARTLFLREYSLGEPPLVNAIIGMCHILEELKKTKSFVYFWLDTKSIMDMKDFQINNFIRGLYIGC